MQQAFRWSGAYGDGAATALLQLAEQHRLEGWVMFAGGDEEMRLVSRTHAELSSVFRLTTEPWPITRWTYDKHLTYERAAALGIDCPRSYSPRDRRELAELPCRFPVVLKPATGEQANAFTLAKAWRADDRATLLARYDQAVALVGADGIVLQEFIPGSGDSQFSYAALWDRGAPIASLVARRTRQFPIEFGLTSTFVETCEEKHVEEAACRFLASLSYGGLVEVEFKYDRRDGRFKLLDINARPWTWIGLGARAGIDFPYLAWQLAAGDRVPRLSARHGIGWMHASRDLGASAQALLAGAFSPFGYIRSLRRPLAFAAFAMDDPVPGIVDLPLALWRYLTRRLPHRFHRSSARELPRDRFETVAVRPVRARQGPHSPPAGT